MALHLIGDSHADLTFKTIPGTIVHWLGPVTMERIGHPDDKSLPTFETTKDDTVLVLCGEIDVRAHVKNRASHLRKSIDQFVEHLCTRYVAKVYAYGRAADSGATFGIVSVPPPLSVKHAGKCHIPFVGTDEERAQYARKINDALRTMCGANGLLFLDIYSLYVNANGMLPPEVSDGPFTHVEEHRKNNKGVHIVDVEKVKDLINEMGLA